MNRFLQFAAMLVVVGCVAVSAKDKEQCTERLCLKVRGQSGKIKISRGNQLKDDKESMVLEFDDLSEYDADNNKVGQKGRDKHSFNTFATLQFTFSELYETTVQGVNASAFNFTAMIPGPSAKLVVTVFFIKDNGTIKLCDGDKYEVMKGAIKFNIEIRDWTFCASESCGKGEKDGKYVQLSSVIKFPNNESAKQENEEEKSEGGEKNKGKKLHTKDMQIEFPKAVDADGSCKSMPEGFPTFGTKGSKEITTYRFNKFNKYVIYDPIIQPAIKLPPPYKDSASTTVHLSMVLAFFAALTKFLF